jgi:hypothetical protein
MAYMAVKVHIYNTTPPAWDAACTQPVMGNSYRLAVYCAK